MRDEIAFLRAIADGDPVARFAYANWLTEQGQDEAAARQRQLAGADQFLRRVELIPAFDKGPRGGIHGVELRMVLVGRKGATQFVLFTNWHLPHVTERFLTGLLDHVETLLMPMPADLGCHAREPQYEGQKTMQRDCPYTGGVCYYDGSVLNAQEVYQTLLREGSEGVWRFLEAVYREQFDE